MNRLLIMCFVVITFVGCEKSNELDDTSGSNKSNIPQVTAVRLIPNAGPARIELRWTNPSFEEFETVAVRRSDDSYPEDPSSGKEIYNGSETTHLDQDDVVEGTTYYYSFFTIISSGEHSEPVERQTTVSSGSGRR